MTTVTELASTTKAPVDFVFTALSPSGSLAPDLFTAGAANSLKEGSVKAAIKALVDAGLVVTRNHASGKRGRPAKLFFRADEAPPMIERPVKAKAVKDASPAPESVETPAVSEAPVDVLTQIQG